MAKTDRSKLMFAYSRLSDLLNNDDNPAASQVTSDVGDILDGVRADLQDVIDGESDTVMLATLKTLSSWLVCYTLTDAEDLMQSAPEMYRLVEAAIAKAEGSK